MKGTKVYYRLHKKDMEHGSMFSTKGLKFTPNVTHVQVGLCPSEWDKEEIFKKSIDLRKAGQRFVFFDGPPTANAKPGLHR